MGHIQINETLWLQYESEVGLWGYNKPLLSAKLRGGYNFENSFYLALEGAGDNYPVYFKTNKTYRLTGLKFIFGTWF